MRVVVMSDSHRNALAVKKIVEKHMESAELFIHLGDGEYETDLIKNMYPGVNIQSVAGNCDSDSMLPYDRIVSLDGAKIFCTHGHRYSLRGGTERLVTTAASRGCNIVLFGHTHERYEVYENGIYIMNPGSCSSPRDGKKPSYGIIDITEKGILTNITDL